MGTGTGKCESTTDPGAHYTRPATVPREMSVVSTNVRSGAESAASEKISPRNPGGPQEHWLPSKQRATGATGGSGGGHRRAKGVAREFASGSGWGSALVASHWVA